MKIKYPLLKQLRAMIRERGVSQLHKDSGVSRSSLNNILNDTCNPRFATIVKIARACNYRVEIILS